MTETQAKTAVQQFADDYLLVMMNNQGEYERLMGWKSLDLYEFAEYIQESFESDMADIIGEKDTPAHWLARQALLCWGIEPFILIAREIKEMEA